MYIYNIFLMGNWNRAKHLSLIRKLWPICSQNLSLEDKQHCDVKNVHVCLPYRLCYAEFSIQMVGTWIVISILYFLP